MRKGEHDKSVCVRYPVIAHSDTKIYRTTACIQPSEADDGSNTKRFHLDCYRRTSEGQILPTNNHFMIYLHIILYPLTLIHVSLPRVPLEWASARTPRRRSNELQSIHTTISKDCSTSHIHDETFTRKERQELLKSAGMHIAKKSNAHMVLQDLMISRTSVSVCRQSYSSYI